MTKILGIAAYYHDSSASLIINGEIIAAAQEERFSRIKHDPSFPLQAICYCLNEANCSLDDLDAVVFYDKPFLKFERLIETYLAKAPIGFRTFLKAMPIWLKEKLYMKTILRRELANVRQLQENNNKDSNDQADLKLTLPKLLFTQHHQAHAASAFYPSPYEKSAIICLDGVGEWATSSIWLGEQENLTLISEINFPHSLGLLYSSFTYYCGFRVNSGEYKLMGLAPYGKPVYVDLIYQHLIDVKDDGSFYLNMDYFDYPVGSVMTNKAFAQLFSGPARNADSELTQKEMDLARSIQQVIEEIVLKIADYTYQQTGCESLCLAGGVALNCVANGRLQREGPFKNIWIQPAAGDAGGSLGAAMLASHQYFNVTRKSNIQSSAHWEIDPLADKMQGSYLGPHFTDTEISYYLDEHNLDYQQINDARLYDEVAKLIEEGSVIGWYQGRIEFGPRALGNRTIVGDPRNQKMQSIMNLKIKNRESFRPFAPAVLAEDVSEYFQLNTPSPYMLLVSEIQSALKIADNNAKAQDIEKNGIELLYQKRSILPAITHVDYSARVQTVHQQTNPKFHALIKAFKDRTGVSVLINTSFNVRGEPPVCSPAEAVNCFMATEMDYLVMNNFILNKEKMRDADIKKARLQTFDLD